MDGEGGRIPKTTELYHENQELKKRNQILTIGRDSIMDRLRTRVIKRQI